MSEKRDKPADPDPDATVTFQRGALTKPDDDATVMMPSRKALEAADEDATVSMTSRALKGPDKVVDEDITVMMPAGGLKAMLAAESAAAAVPPAVAAASAKPSTGVPLAAFRTDADPDATVMAPKPPPPQPPAQAASGSRMPLIFAVMVVVAVILYFMMTGTKQPAPVAPKPDVAAAAAPMKSPPPTAAPAAPAPVPATPAASSAPAPATAPAAPAAAPAPSSSKLADLLAADIKRGAIAVKEEGGRTSITLSDANQFASGGVDAEPKLRPLLVSIAAALDKTGGPITVIGHADANPSSHPKYPSNEALSAARAASVAKVMAPKLGDPKRLASEGAGDSQPLGPSDTAANRAKNRRVVIVLKPS